MKHWPKVPISETYLGLFDGPHATPKPSDEGPIFLGIGNITEDGHLDLNNIRHIAEDDFDNWTRRVVPQAGDIVFTYEATLNRYAIISDGFRGCLGRRLALIRPNPAKVDTRFLHYSFFSEDWRRTITANLLSGATVDRIPLTHFPKFEIFLPPLGHQRRIASILSAYDDLIENNMRRIAILEEMARALYQEWFVHFRFPGHEHVPLAPSPLGPIPEGWEVARLGEVCEKVTDGAHHSPKSIDCNDGKPMASVKDMHDWGLNLEGCRRISIEDFERLERNHCRPKRGDILIAKDGANLNKHTFLVTEDEEVVLLSSIAIITPGQRVRPEFLCEQLKEPRVSKRIKRSVSGAAIPRIILKDFKKLLLIVPPIGVQNEWERLACPLLNLCRNLVQRSKILRTTRDLLLPKLISGEVDVSALPEELIAEAAD